MHNPGLLWEKGDDLLKAFTKHVIGLIEKETGLYGRSSGYYGTVEQQGRLTLHLHMLLWIQDSLSSLESRERIINPGSDFQKELVEYLESSHVGEFLNGTVEDVRAQIDSETDGPRYVDPTTTLPDMPPMPCPVGNCKKCPCCKKDDVCEVDPKTGHINLKKGEAWINTFTPIFTYLLRCNSDVTSLLSGTAIKAVIAYVTDYVSKSPLKICGIFESIRDVFDRNTETLCIVIVD
ncbi:hypothetical protein K439DRAFT_1648102 [Ramaria rubella]|nr:hypothetical protein K439DRAFT_1648102 [Ramaria rubella]